MVNHAEKQKVIILNGSPRSKNGNTAALIDLFKSSLKNKKLFTIEQFDLYSLKIQGCLHCDECKKNLQKPGCVLKDDGLMVLDALLKADWIIIASPIYCWSVTGCMSSLLDRFYALFKEKKSLIKDKKVIGLFTAGGDTFDGMDLCVQMLKNLCAYGEANYVTTLPAVYCTAPNSLKRELAVKINLHQTIKQMV